MSNARVEIALILAGIVTWAAIFAASAQGLLHVSWIVSDGLLTVLGMGSVYGFWRLYRRWSRKNA